MMKKIMKIDRKTKLLLVLLVLCVAITVFTQSCAPVDSRQDEDGGYATRVNIGGGISRFVDDDAGVVCWIYSGYNIGGLSCLPIADTLLETR